MFEILADMKKKKNNKIQLIPIVANAIIFQINSKNVSVTENGIKRIVISQKF